MNTLSPIQSEAHTQKWNKNLEEQVAALVEWKQKAVIQLEYFRAACRLYNFCDVSEVNELLNQSINGYKNFSKATEDFFD